MIFNKHSVTFDEITYDPKVLYDKFLPMFGNKATLATSTMGKCEIVDINKYEGKSLKHYPEVLALSKFFPILEEEHTRADEMARIFFHEPGAGIPPHIDEKSNCAILMPITWPTDPVLYFHGKGKDIRRGNWWQPEEFTLDDLDWIHQYTYGHPSLINSSVPHYIKNTNPDKDRAILRFRISVRTYDECLEMCRNGTFLNLD